MLNPKENFLETIKIDGKPDRLVKQFEGLSFIVNDPVNLFIRGERYPGMEPKLDKWGTTILWPEGSAGAMPHVTSDTKVIRDIKNWRDYTSVPDLVSNCSDPALWEPFLQRVNEIDRENNLVMMFAPTGLFERLHFLMGFEDLFINMMVEPEAMAELCEAIGEYRYQGFKLMVENAKPDAILSHDDWGSKDNLFISPDSWREYIKKNYQKSYDYLHENGVVIIHHSDSYCEPIVQDMIDLHIDVWQGAIPQNNLVEIQKQTKGNITLMGGIDAAIVDREDSTEEETFAEVRRACEEYGPGGHFIPSITYGGPGSIYPNTDLRINAEIDRYNKKHFGN